MLACIALLHNTFGSSVRLAWPYRASVQIQSPSSRYAYRKGTFRQLLGFRLIQICSYHLLLFVIRRARRMFSVSVAGIITSSGAVLWCQSMKPIYGLSTEHLTQVVVCGSASIRADGMGQLQWSQYVIGMLYSSF